MKNMLSPHFSLRECEKSDYAIRHGLDNSLPEKFRINAESIAVNILEPVRKQWGVPFSPSSWYRGDELNKAIGGSSKSQHCTASAVDFEVPGVPNLDVAFRIRDNLDFDQLILEYYTGGNTGWIHCSRAENNRYQSLRFNGKQYLQGLI